MTCLGCVGHWEGSISPSPPPRNASTQGHPTTAPQRIQCLNNLSEPASFEFPSLRVVAEVQVPLVADSSASKDHNFDVADMSLIPRSSPPDTSPPNS